MTLIMPVRNEAAYIERSLGAVLAQDYPAERMEIIVVDGASTDHTREIIQGFQAIHANLQLIENPQKIVPVSLNAALRVAKGDVIVRVDGHCIIVPDYVSRCVKHLRSKRVDCVGGPIDTVGESPGAQTIAVAMSSPFGVGGVPFRTIKDRALLVDSVAFPAYTRQAVEKAGFFDEELVRNQDDEYNYRLRKLGGKILLSPDIHSSYYSRTSLKSLWRQYFQYGYWKVRVMQKHPQQMALRQFIPPVFVLALVTALFLSMLYPFGWLSLAAVAGSYSLANLAASFLTAHRHGWGHLILLPLIFTILHLSYGCGFLVGLVKFANRWGDEGKTAKEREKIADIPVPELRFAKAVDFPSWVTFLDNVVRRSLDIMVSTAGLIILAPLFLLIATRIKRDSSGPIFFWGPRAGKNGKIFNILKFRTMYETSNTSEGPIVTAHDDPRITPFGRWLRETKLNELPQLWNVLKGEMCLVGPRPEDPKIAAKWSEDLRWEILSVLPGITSPASIVYRNEESMIQSKNVMDEYLWNIMPSKLRLDQLYIRHRSILTDIDVIFWTAIVLLPSLKRVSVPEHLLYRGPLSVFFERYFTWFLVDILVSFGAVATAGLVWRIGAPLDLGWKLAMGIALAIAFLFSLINSIIGISRVTWSKARAGDVLDLAISCGLVTVVLFLVNLFRAGGYVLPPGMPIVAGMFSFFGFVFVRYRSRLITGLSTRWIHMRGEPVNLLGERVLVVGAGEVAEFALWLFRNGDLARAFSVAGMVDDDPRKMGAQIDGLRVIGKTKDIPALVNRLDIGLILFAITNITPDEQERILSICQSMPARLIMMPDVLDTLRAHFPRDENDRDKLFGRILDNTTIDKLTGIYNRHQFLKLAEREVPRARRYQRPMSLIMLSIDYHRPENATYLPGIGAQVLRAAAEICRKDIREVDLLGRYNGKEFALLLPETDQSGAQIVADRLTRDLTSQPLWTDFGPLSITLHLGTVTSKDDLADIESLVDCALQTLKNVTYLNGQAERVN